MAKIIDLGLRGLQVRSDPSLWTYQRVMLTSCAVSMDLPHHLPCRKHDTRLSQSQCLRRELCHVRGGLRDAITHLSHSGYH